MWDTWQQQIAPHLGRQLACGGLGVLQSCVGVSCPVDQSDHGHVGQPSASGDPQLCQPGLGSLFLLLTFGFQCI